MDTKKEDVSKVIRCEAAHFLSTPQQKHKEGVLYLLLSGHLPFIYAVDGRITLFLSREA